MAGKAVVTHTAEHGYFNMRSDIYIRYLYMRNLYPSEVEKFMRMF